MRSALVFLVLAACGDGFDLDFDLSHDSTSIGATAVEDGSLVVTVCGGPAGFLSCTDDTYEITVAGTSTPSSPGLFGESVASFPAVAAGDTATVVRDRDGSTAVATVPDPFELQAFSHEGGLSSLAWSPVSDQKMTWAAESDCPDSSSFSPDHPLDDDTGELVLQLGDFPSTAAGCTQVVTLTRHLAGVVQAGYAEGAIVEGTQTRSVTVTLR